MKYNLIKKIFYILVLIPLTSLAPIDIFIGSKVIAAEPIEVWWPRDGMETKNTEALKAVQSGQSTDNYKMYWQVDGGVESEMPTNHTDYPHKETSIDVASWNWNGRGPYVVTLKTKSASGEIIAQKNITLYNGNLNSTTPQSPTPTIPPSTTQVPQSQVSIWWPLNGASISGTQPFKAVLDNNNVSNYKMYWQIEGQNKVEMPTNYTDHPHKEVDVNVSNWNGTKDVTFTATDLSGNELGRKVITVSTPTTPNSSTPQIPSNTPAISNPFSNTTFYINPYSNSARQVELWAQSRPADSLQMTKISSQPDAEWFGNWNSNIENDVSTYITKTGTKLPIMVAYNIPQRDCGGYSSGGSNSAENYKNWIRAFARGIGNRKAVVILEPDALPALDCLNSNDQNTRLMLLKDAVQVLKSNSNTAVYIDAGHSNWNTPDTTASRLTTAGINVADGFSLNISNFYRTSENISFGTQVSNLLNGKHFIIDTSRNGNGSNNEWCNPSGRALGENPTSNTGNILVDAFLWIKKPGDSDGACNGAPSAGTWMPEYALELAKNKH